ncbi:hypothetical protein K7G98_23080, partial [Saccharothrix sp. MB29]|nr:hypothetical protein [Saccharothrix sp. MB29]
MDDRLGLDRLAAEIAGRTPWSESDDESSSNGVPDDETSDDGRSENGGWADLGGLAAEIAGQNPWSASDRGEVRSDAPTPEPEPRSAWSAWGSDSESDSEHGHGNGEPGGSDVRVDGRSTDVVGVEWSETAPPGADPKLSDLAAEAARARRRLEKLSMKYYNDLFKR